MASCRLSGANPGVRKIPAAAVLAAFLFSFCGCADAASAQDNQAALIEQARVAIAAGNISEGERLLTQVDDTATHRNDLDFLRGTLAAAEGDYTAAIAHFRALLRRDPSLNRVRLDLAHAYFLKGDDVAAERYFRAAAAQGVPPEVQKNIDAFLDQIRRRKHWDASVSLAVAPDTNINAATAAPDIDLFGLPFQLSPTAREQSGVGLTANLAASYQWDVAANTRLKVGGAYDDTEYSNQAFTDRNLNAYIGPDFLLSQGADVSVEATATRRWYGGDLLASSVGGRVDGQVTLSPRLLLAATFSGQMVYYAPAYAPYTGPVAGLSATLTYAPDSLSFYRALGGVVREQTTLAALRDTQYSIGGGYYREALPKGFAVYGEVRGTIIPYDAPLPAFGLTRHDVEMDYRLSVSNSRIDVYGFTPLVSYLHTDRYSNVALYAFTRNRVELGVTRAF